MLQAQLTYVRAACRTLVKLTHGDVLEMNDEGHVTKIVQLKTAQWKNGDGRPN
jgi:hypothetical protein